MKVVGYVRVSTTKQVQFGLSLEDQQQKIRQYCELYDLDLVQIIVDGGESAETLNRKGIQEAIHLLESNEVSGLIVTKLDRLTRSIKDLNYLLENLFKKASLFSVSELIDTRSPGGRLVLNILTSVSQWERETIAERTSSALQAKKAKSKKRVVNGGAPYGWEWVEGELIEIPNQQESLAMMRRLYNSGNTYREISKHMNDMGIPTKKNIGKWNATTIRNNIKREPYDKFKGGQAPLGWECAGAGQLIPCVKEQELISLVRDYKKAGLSYQTIANDLTESNFTTRAGSLKFSKTAVKRLNDAETIEERAKRLRC